MTELRAGRRWTSAEVRQLKQLVGENRPLRLIALKLQRSAEAVSSKASGEGISLKRAVAPPSNPHTIDRMSPIVLTRL
jgi:hypothetical protein